MLVNNVEYKVEVIRKNNKNTYIRIKNNTIIVTTNYFTTNKQIEKLLLNNINSLERMASRVCKKEEKQNDSNFYLFGKSYTIIYDNSISNIDIQDNKIIIQDEKKLKKFLDNYLKNTFKNHLEYWYQQFEEVIPKPTLKIRTMKSRWGVCNTKTYNITLNKELHKYDIDCLDYVCIHELSHLIHPNHSKDFWSVVSKYCPNYKEIRKKLRD
jgi:hypothetical protein